MTGDSERVAVLETRMNYLERVVADSQQKMAEAIDTMKAIVANHDTDVKILKEDRDDRKKLINMIYAALIGAILEPILIGLAFWFAQKPR